MRNSSRWFRAAGIGLAAMLLMAALALFLQTPLGFRLVWHPVLSRVLPGTLGVRTGHVTWTGRVEAHGVAWNAPELGLALEAEGLRLALIRQPGAGLMPAIGSLELRGATLALGPGPVHPEPEAPAEEDAPFRIAIPLLAERVRATDLTVTWSGADETHARFGPGVLAASRVRPGATASLRLAGPLEIAPDATARSYAGETDLDLALALGEAGVVESWDGRGRVTLGRATGEIRPALLTYELDSRGVSRSDPDGFASIHGEASLAAREGAEPVGEASGLLRLRESARGRLDSIRIELELRRLTEHFLDPLLAPALGSALASARLDGRMSVETHGESVRLEGSLAGADWRLESHPTAPALGFGLNHRATYAITTRTLDLESVEVTLDDGPARLATLRLREPLRLYLNGLRTTDETNDSIGIDAMLDGPLEDLQPWLAALEIPAASWLQRGRIASELHLEVASGTNVIGVRGRLGLRGVDPGAGVPDRGPYGLRSELEARLEDFETLILERAPLTLLLRGDPILQAEVKGRLGGAESAVDLDARIERLRWRGLTLSEGELTLRHTAGSTRIELDRARLLEGSSQARFILADDALKWDVEIAEARLPLVLAALGHPGNPGSDSRLRLTTEGTWQLAERVLALDELEASVTDRGARLASAQLTAPLALDLDDDRVMGSASGPVRVEARLGEASLAEFRPWLTLLGLPLAEAAADGRFASELHLVVDGPANRIGISGLVSVRGVELDERAPHPGPFDLRAELAAQLDGLTRLTLERAPVILSLRDTPIVAAQIRGRLEQESAEAGGLRADLEADLERLGWGDAQLEGGRLMLRHESRKTHLELADTRLAGGSLGGSATHQSLPDGRQVIWRTQGAGIQVARVIRAFQPDETPWLEGTLSLESEGASSAAAGAPLLEAAEGELRFEITDATVRRSIVLSLLTDWARIASLKEGRFSQIRGDFALEGGLARIRDMEATGPTGKLRFRGGLDLVGGEADVVVVSRIGPELAERLGPAQRLGLDWAVGKAQDLVTLPVDVRITGPILAPEYHLRARGTGSVERVVQGGSTVLKGTARGTSKAVGTGSRWLRDAAGGLLRRAGGGSPAEDEGPQAEPGPVEP